MRRLLSLDFVLEHPGMNWLPAEPEKVEFFEKLGLPRPLDSAPDLLRCGLATRSATLRSNCPLPWTLKPSPLPTSIRATRRIRELHSWGAAHGPLWDALRKKGRQVRVIGIAVENATVDRTARVLEAWAAADPGTSHEGLTVKQEIKAIRRRDETEQSDGNFLASSTAASGPAMKRSAALNVSPKPRSRKGSRLTTIRHGGPCGLRTRMRSAERGKIRWFLCHWGPHVKCLPQGSEGGVYQNFRLRCTTTTFLYLSHSAVVIPCESAPPVPSGRKRGDESDPPRKAGGHVTPIAALCHTPLSGPMGVALVLIYPCGKARNSPQEGR